MNSAVSGLRVGIVFLLVLASVAAGGVSAAQASGGGIDDLRIANAVDEDGDGKYSGFDVSVRADTRLPDADPDTSDPTGEPRLKLVVGGEDTSMPGFGVNAALVALLSATLLAIRRRTVG